MNISKKNTRQTEKSTLTLETNCIQTEFKKGKMPKQHKHTHKKQPTCQRAQQLTKQISQ